MSSLTALERVLLPAFTATKQARELTTLGLHAHRAGEGAAASGFLQKASDVIGKAGDRVERAHTTGATAYGLQNAFVNNSADVSQALRTLSKDVLNGAEHIEQSMFAASTSIGVGRANLSALRHEAYIVTRPAG